MFQVVFYETGAGNEIILNFIRGFDANDKRKICEDLMTVQIGYPLGLPLCRPLGNGLSEVRISLPSKREVRLIFTFDSETQSLIVLHAFIKKTQKTPKADLQLAKSRKGEFAMKGIQP